MTRRLNVQYRMHEAIMNFSSQQFYDADLEAHASVRGASPVRPARRDGQSADANAGPVHRHRRRRLRRGAGADGKSRLNPQEASWSAARCRRLLDAGVAGRGDRGDRSLRGPGSAAARQAADSRPGDRQRGRLPGTREGGGGAVAGSVQCARARSASSPTSAA